MEEEEVVVVVVAEEEEEQQQASKTLPVGSWQNGRFTKDCIFFSMTTWTAESVSKDMRLALITYDKCLIWDTVCTINFLHIFPLNQTFSFFFFLTRGHSASNYTLDKGHKAQRCFKM